MNSDPFHRAKAIFLEALDLQLGDRAAFIERRCGDDERMRAEVESLLESARSTDVGGATDVGTGGRIGRYKLLQKIGEGGFGTVWMAAQREPVKRRVALKIIKLGMDTKQVIARFEAERQALAMMDHPNIAKVLDAGTTESGRPYFVMEYIRGVQFIDYCDRERLDTTARLRVFGKVCHAIQHAHHKGIVHRDIKPSNVLITLHDGFPVPKVIDFGIAKAMNSELTTKTLYTAHRQMVGTPAYMSPEQAEMSGLDIDTRSDIYSLGVLLYELLTGTTPFETESLLEAGLAEMMRIIRETEPPRPSTRLSMLGDEAETTAALRRVDVNKLGLILRGDLDWIVMQCLEKDRTRRYETANALAADVERYLRNVPVEARPPSASYLFRKYVGRHRGQVVAAGIVVATFVLGLVGTSAGMLWALNEKARANQAVLREREATKDAIRERDSANWHVYLSNLGIADAAIATAGVGQARLRLEECAPEHRGWEWEWLNASLDRSIAVLHGHSRSVRFSSFSPDASLILTGSWDGTARLWDSVSGEPLHVLEGLGGAVHAARFSTDGAMILTASQDGTVRLWDGRTGAPIGDALIHESEVVDARFDGRGTRLVAACADGTARIWSVTEPGRYVEIAPAGGPVIDARLDPGGERVLTVTGAGALHVWDASTGAVIFDLSDGGVSAAAFSPDGTRIAVAFIDGTIRFLDASVGRTLTRVNAYTGEVTALAFSTDDQKLLSVSVDRTVRVWNAMDGALITVLRGHLGTIRAASFNPAGTQVLTASADRTARIWDARTGEVIALLRGHDDDVWSAAFDASGARVITGALDRTARVWYPMGDTNREVLLGHDGPLTAAQFKDHGRRILTSSMDGTVRVWSTTTGALVRSVDADAPVLCLAVSHDGRIAATGAPGGEARLWDGAFERMSKLDGGDDSDVTGVAFSPEDARLVTAHANGRVRVWDVASGELTLELDGHGQGATCASFSPDGTKIVSGGADRLLSIWNASTGERLSVLEGHQKPVTCAIFDAAGTRVISASEDASAKIWDSAEGTLVADLLGHEDMVFSVAYAPDGRRIITASRDDTVRLWDPDSGSEVAVIRGHEGAVSGATFSPDGTHVVSASHDQTAHVWTTMTYRRQCAEWLAEMDESAAKLADEASSQSEDWTSAAEQVRGQEDVGDRARLRALILLTIMSEEARSSG